MGVLNSAATRFLGLMLADRLRRLARVSGSQPALALADGLGS